jgi:adenylate kinase
MSQAGPSGTPIQVVLVGRPGSGKGTQGIRLAGVLGVPHIAAGDLLRAEIDRASDVGRRIAATVAEGRLVPDGLVMEALAHRLARDDVGTAGFVLDGFPRSVPQAIVLERLIAPSRLTCALELHLPEREASHRLLARRRADDRVPVIRRRFDEFERLTRPLIEWLDRRGLLITLDATPAPDAVGEALLRALAALVDPVGRSRVSA